MSLNHFMSISSKKMDRVEWEITKLVNGRNWMVPLLQETLCENHGGIQPLTSLLTENRSDAVYLVKVLGDGSLKHCLWYIMSHFIYSSSGMPVEKREMRHLSHVELIYADSPWMQAKQMQTP